MVAEYFERRGTMQQSERDHCCKKEREIRKQAPETARGNWISTEELADNRRSDTHQMK